MPSLTVVVARGSHAFVVRFSFSFLFVRFAMLQKEMEKVHVAPPASVAPKAVAVKLAAPVPGGVFSEESKSAGGGATAPVKRKRKGPRGPNPLSVKASTKVKVKVVVLVMRC